MNKANVNGVRGMDTSGLEVKEWADDWLRRQEKLSLSDKQIKNAVFDVLRYDPRIQPFDIELSVTNGAVVLTGRVDNLKAKHSAQSDAENIVGVDNVINGIKVERELTKSDWAIEKDVANILKWDPYLERFNVSIWVEHSKVYLYGRVDNQFLKEHAAELVSRVDGVTAIKNHLRVHDKPWPHKSDVSIESDIKQQLQWNPTVDQNDVTVSVTDGVVKYEGTVDTWNEYDAVLKSAFKSGAKAVKTDLKVKSLGLKMNVERFYGHQGYVEP
ncbi:MAG: BON domain-containing protein [Chitinivibrionales bacterium]|nr:BON domain-containing protein [Chitinivibrionales bacterium]